MSKLSVEVNNIKDKTFVLCPDGVSEAAGVTHPCVAIYTV